MTTLGSGQSVATPIEPADRGTRWGTLIRVVAVTGVLAMSHGRICAQETIDGTPFLAGSRQHISRASTDVRSIAPTDPARGTAAAGADGLVAFTGRSGALVINPTFDSSITSDPNSAAIQTMINDAISIYESTFNDPITVSILFRYATTDPGGGSLPSGTLAQSDSVLYILPWSNYTAALTADATTANDAMATANLPGSPLSTNILPSSANGRSVSLATPPAMFADGSIGVGGPYDGIVTLNSSHSFKFTRPPASGFYDALRTTEHEMDEVLGLGSSIMEGSDLRPQDLFSWSSAGVRNVTASGSRYFSIDGGTTNLVDFNQDPSGDFGDWLSGSCPQTNPYVQNAFSCANQVADVTVASPEGVNLDVIGYDLIVGTPTPTPTPAPPATCGATPIGGCDGPGNGTILIQNDGDNTKDKMLWKWLKGPLTGQSDFGDPTGATSYTLCVYDDNGITESLVVPPVINWNPISTKGYLYKDASGSVFGITKILLKGGGAGKSKILVKGKGGNLPQPALAFSQSINVTVQLLRNDNPQCWESVFAPPAVKTSGTQFKDKF